MNTSTGGSSSNNSLASSSSSSISNSNHNPMMNLSSSSSSSMMFPQFPFPPPPIQPHQPWFHPHPASVSIQQLLSDHAVNAPSPTSNATSSSPQLFHRMHDLLTGGSAAARVLPHQLLGGQKSGQGVQQQLSMPPWMYNNDSGFGTEVGLGLSGIVDEEQHQQQQMLLGLLGLPADQNQNQGIIDAEQGQKRKRQKRSPIWRYFKQLPAPEQGVTCQICQNNIKIINSRTNYLYHHLRTFHQKELEIVMEERISKMFKNDVERQKILQEKRSKVNVPQNSGTASINNTFTVKALIEGQQKPKIRVKRRIVEQQNAEKAMAEDEGGKSTKSKKTTISDNTSDDVKKALPKISLVRIGNRKWSRKSSKLKPTNATKMTKTKTATKAKTTKSTSNTNKTARPEVEVEQQQQQQQTEPEPDIIFLASTVGPQQQQTGREGTLFEQHQQNQQRVNDWISVQIGAMLLVDRTEFLLDRVGFRQFIRTLLPQYAMPSTAQFRALILPRVARQLDTQLAQKFRHNNPFGLPASSPSIDLLQQQQHGFGMSFPHQQHNPFSNSNCFLQLINRFGTSLQHNQQKQHMMANNPFNFSAGPPSFNSPFSLSSPHQQHNNQQSMTGNNPLGQSCLGGITNTGNLITTSQPRPDLQPTNSSTSNSSNSASLSSFSASAGGTAVDEDTQPPSSSSSSSGGLLDELIKQAFLNSQNISQSFTRSIDL